MRKVFCFYPAFGQHLTAATFMTSHALAQAFTQKGIQCSTSTLSFPDIAELRSMATTIWYDAMPDVDYLLFIDSDMGFPPDMVLDMMLFGEPVVGAIYPQRNLPVSWAGSGTGEATTERRGNFMKVEGVGMGCTLIRRDAITKMIEKFPELIDSRIAMQPYGKILQGAGCNRLIRLFDKMNIPERGWVSEDLSFCIRHRQCGGEVWAAIGYRISHVGPYDYGQCYLEHTQQQQAIAEQQAAQIAALIAQQQQAIQGAQPQQLMFQPGGPPLPVAVPIPLNDISDLHGEILPSEKSVEKPGATKRAVIAGASRKKLNGRSAARR